MSRLAAVGVAGVAGVAAAALAVLWLSSPIDPVPWTPAPAPAWTANEALQDVAWWPVPGSFGPEDVHVLPDGRVVGGTDDGTLWVWPADGGRAEVLANTGGRPLGLHLAPDGRLLVADAFEGLLAVDVRTGGVQTIVAEVDGRPLHFADDLDVTSDGIVLLSDASAAWDQHHWRLDLMENRPHGRLVAVDLSDGRAWTVLDGLYFANGVALEPGEDSVLVNETARYRVRRVWWRGERAGDSEVVIDNLPGFNDGISRGEDGVYWVALATPRLPVMDRSSPYPWLRRIMASLPQAVQPGPVEHAWVIGIDADGRVVHDLQDATDPSVAVVTSVQEHGGRLYLGSLVWPGLGVVAVPQ